MAYGRTPRRRGRTTDDAEKTNAMKKDVAATTSQNPV
jgi:hypothetical protein